GFHLAPVFAPIFSNATYPNSEAAIIGVMKQQFTAWGHAFRTSRAAGALTIRFFSGKAIAFCQALDLFASTGRAATGIHVLVWCASRINFDKPSASQPPAPSSFDVINTSNLTDHLGLLNILLVAQPLLKTIPASQAVLYTETLLPMGEDVTKSFLDRVCASIPTISALLGIAPRAYVSAFAAHSNSHELLSPSKANQYHERVAWADPSGRDHYASPKNIAVSFNAEDLAHLIFGFYDKMFANEQVVATMATGLSLAKRRSMEDICYHQETVVALLQLIKRRVQLKTGSWDSVADELLGMVEDDRS
ncbi:hypothetical protein FRC06_004833, partial [Ceratobasidium sp. 370]